MLFRAICSSTRHESEFVVFFEAFDRAAAHVRIDVLLPEAWHTPAFDLYVDNLCSESDLQANALRESSGDARLFEVGMADGDAVYADPLTTQFLVSPPMFKRLRLAQERLPSAALADAL